MGSPYVGEIRMFGGNFAPAGWMFCDGGVLPISENETLFNLIGTTYGGDGEQTFALPDLRGRIPVHMGGEWQFAQNGGVEAVTLQTTQIPSHTHPLTGTTSTANDANATNNLLAQPSSTFLYLNVAPSVAMAAQSIGPAGGNQPHENRQPFLCIQFIISLFGIFPPHN